MERNLNLSNYLNKLLSFCHKGGPRIKKPMMAADPAAIKTALAPTSFPTFANSCCSGLAKSTTASRAVLINSAVQTIAIAMMIIAQSWASKPNQMDTRITAILTMA